MRACFGGWGRIRRYEFIPVGRELQMNSGYIVRRLAWRWFPGLLYWRRVHLQNIPARRGRETLKPKAAIDRYLAGLKEVSFSIKDKRVFILGYGGRFSVACKLLELGAGHVALCDPYVTPDHAHNRTLLPEYGIYLREQNEQVLPQSEYLTLYSKDIRQVIREHTTAPFDLVISSSVFEHIKDVEETVEALNGLTCRQGVGLHFIDLRDHLYSYPFEMLTYPSFIWHHGLNPTSHLNRYRLWNYRSAFSQYFSQVTITIEENNEQAFALAAPHIRSEFKSGNLLEDSATFIRVIAQNPKPIVR